MALSFRRLVGRVAVGALAVAVPVVLTPPPASAAPTELFFSEYIEGSSNNKAVEIYNGTGVAVDRHRHPGQMHGFFTLLMVPGHEDAIEQIATSIDTHLPATAAS